MVPPYKDDYDQMQSLIDEVKLRDRNEAETRHKIIDFILHDYLAWPKNRVSVEEYINPGFADYILKKENSDDLLFIEAKKEGVFFELPAPSSKNETSCYIAIKKLITNDNIKSAMYQVRGYCLNTGCEYAAISNGHEWIFFKTFEKGKRWEDLQAFVIRELSFFINEYTKAKNLLSFVAITDNAALSTMLTTYHPKDRSIFYPKEKIVSYSHEINSNRLASIMRPLANHYFGVIEDDDTDFMDKCYVSQREYDTALYDIHGLIHDSLTPYFEEYGVQQLEDTGKGGKLGGRLSKNIKKERKGEVLTLFGGKGAGKSTFIKRLLHHTPPRWLHEHSVISIIDFLNIPEEKNVIRTHLWKSLLVSLDKDNLLDEERDQLLEKLFKDRYTVAKKQDLFGLQPTSETYNIKLNELIVSWKNDFLYCAKKLVDYWSLKSKGVIVVVDNTDQYSLLIQDFCFTSAQEISKELDCVTLISMREERFYNSKIHGVLDAFQNSGFHISSPNPSQVFRKRLDYVINLLKTEGTAYGKLGSVAKENITDETNECKIYLKILSSEFSNHKSPLTSFLAACSHGDTRLSLDLFRSFLISGYTNVDEMINAGNWNFKIHQVIKPVMIPKRYFYDESLSDIPNIYQLRSNRHSSHFTALRILRKISKGSDSTSPSYHDVTQLRSYFSEVFNMVEDFEKNVDILLKHSFIQANNRLDTYSENVDRIKITNYGLYMIKELAFYFTYLELICVDCGIYTEKSSNYLSESARKEYALFNRGEKLERIKVRLDGVQHFLNYLSEEESKEKELYSLEMPESGMFTYKAREEFSKEKIHVLRSAERQSNNKRNTRNKKR